MHDHVLHYTLSIKHWLLWESYTLLIVLRSVFLIDNLTVDLIEKNRELYNKAKDRNGDVFLLTNCYSLELCSALVIMNLTKPNKLA